MRLPLIAILMTGACMADVGGGPGDRAPDDDITTRCAEKDAKAITESIRIASEDDFDQVPKGCWTLHGKLTLDGAGITSLERLDRLVAVTDLELKNTGLMEIDTVNPLRVYGSVVLTNNDQLEDLSRLDVVTDDAVRNIKMTITGNSQLTSLDFLDSIERIDQGFVVTGNPKLASAALSSLIKVGGEIRIGDNAALKDIDLPSLESIGDGLEISNNEVLTTVRGMPLREMVGNVTIRNNRVLATLGAMSKLARLDGSAVFDDNDALTSITMFPAGMGWITGSLTITNNAKLTSLGAIPQLGIGISGSVIITHNPQLSSCVAKQVDDCVNTGNVTINNNYEVATCPASSCPN
ncbi:MAG: hypothetical protein AB7P03_26410 [Kofleriaceae bacterium]